MSERFQPPVTEMTVMSIDQSTPPQSVSLFIRDARGNPYTFRAETQRYHDEGVRIEADMPGEEPAEPVLMLYSDRIDPVVIDAIKSALNGNADHIMQSFLVPQEGIDQDANDPLRSTE